MEQLGGTGGRPEPARYGERVVTSPGSGNSEVASWIRQQARPFELTAQAVIPGLAEANPVILGLGLSVRTARELVIAAHAALRALVLHGGVRAVAIEGTDVSGPALDRYVTQGAGDPVALLRSGQGFLHTTEALEVINWMRAYNVHHADDALRVVHDDTGAVAPSDLESIERMLARRDLAWHERTGQRIVHWGGIAHLVVGNPRTLHPYGETQRSAGAHLRDALGDGYRAVAMTTGAGAAPYPLPQAPPTFTEVVFEHASAPAVLIDLKAHHEPSPAIESWLDSPLKTRCIGPGYDPARAEDFHLDTGPLRRAVDYFLHVSKVTPAHPLSRD
jgi:erythromycin esterase